MVCLEEKTLIWHRCGSSFGPVHSKLLWHGRYWEAAKRRLGHHEVPCIILYRTQRETSWSKKINNAAVRLSSYPMYRCSLVYTRHACTLAFLGKFPCPHPRLRIWFCETLLTVPSRISLLPIYTNAESCDYSRGSSRCPRRCAYILTSTTDHRVSHECIGSRNCVPMAFTAESPLAQGQ